MTKAEQEKAKIKELDKFMKSEKNAKEENLNPSQKEAMEVEKKEFYKVVKTFFEVKRKKKFLRQTIPKLFFTTLTLSIDGRNKKHILAPPKVVLYSFILIAPTQCHFKQYLPLK